MYIRYTVHMIIFQQKPAAHMSPKYTHTYTHTHTYTRYSRMSY